MVFLLFVYVKHKCECKKCALYKNKKISDLDLEKWDPTPDLNFSDPPKR